MSFLPGLYAGDAAGQARFLACRRVAVKHSLGCGGVDALDGQPQKFFGVILARLGGLGGGGAARPHFRMDSAVALATLLVLPVSLYLALDVGQFQRLRFDYVCDPVMQAPSAGVCRPTCVCYPKAASVRRRRSASGPEPRSASGSLRSAPQAIPPNFA